MIRVQRDDFIVEDVLRELKEKKSIGAIVSFTGVVRAEEGLNTIEIESYDEMTSEKMAELSKNAKKNFGVEDVSIIHRVGALKPGDNIVLIAVSSPHRKEAFRACEWLIDELKKIVPIWKKEITDDKNG
jgi:molybdopterin synthase catalytic subunit